MKVRNIFTGLLITIGIIATFSLLHAQQIATPVQNGTSSLANLLNEDVSGLSDFEVELKALELLPTIPAARATNGNNFYTIQHSPESAVPWPPLPADLVQLPAWSLGDGFYLLDDRDYVWGQPKKLKSKTTLQSGGGIHAMDVPSVPGDGGDGGDDGDDTPMFGLNPDYSTNLWLEITNLTGGTAGLLVSNTIADVLYEVQGATNVASPQWVSEGFFYGSELTNWTPTSIVATNFPNLFLRIRSWISSDGSGIPDWWEILYFGTTGIDPYGDPDGDGWNNLQEFQNGTDPTAFNTPPTPQGVTASYNAANGTATVNWLPSPGAVTGYKVIINGVTNSVSTNTLTLTEAASNDPYNYYWDGPNAFLTYQVEADYAGGHSVESDSLLLEQDSPNNVHIIPGPAGAAYLAADVSALPPGTTAIRLTRFDESADPDTITNFDVPLSAFTNGLFLLPTAWVVSPLNEYDSWWVETVENGSANSAANLVSWYPFADGFLFPSYFDGRVQLKQNLIFQLRAATENSQFEFTEINLVSDNYADSILYPNNYVYSGFYQMDDGNGSAYLPDYTGAGTVDPYWPFHDNVRYRNFVFNSTNLTSGGYLNTGAGYDYHYTSLAAGMSLVHPLVFEFEIQTNYSSMLATNDTRWLYAYPHPLSTGLDPSPIGFATNSAGGWTFAGSAHNYWGLPFISAKLAYTNSTTTTLNPGDSYSPPTGVSSTSAYMETAQPQFSTVEYDFWDSSPVPGSSGFSPTNQSDVLIAPVGNSIQVNGYAKLAVVNSIYSGVYGYLGQYFDQAYQIDTNGITTTNTTGVLSPYGSFFATQPGPTALVTMPDPDTGARGTATVYCVSLNLDANHDGTMDLSFNGADATSQSKPMEFWVNNGYDGVEGDAEVMGGVPPNYSVGNITVQRDLENFARLWVCGMPALPASQNYTVTLSWQNTSGSPAINLYNSTETNGGTGYLTDTNIAAQQSSVTFSGTPPYSYQVTGMGVAIAQIASGTSFTFPASYFTNSGNKYFLFEGAGIGSGELTMTISQNGNTVAQTGVWLDLHDIKDFYEQAHTENIDTAPPSTKTSVLVKDKQLAVNPDEDQQVIVYVHGLNTSEFDYYDTSETMFKRLYWQGYQGRFAAFRWPSPLFALIPTSADEISYLGFNNGEYISWHSGAALKAYIDDLHTRLPGYTMNLAAHSLGNVAANEAIREGAQVDHYALMQAAVSAGAFDGNNSALTYDYLAASASSSPDADALGGYGNCATNQCFRVNFYNDDDWALFRGPGQMWEGNQLDYKPDTFISGGFQYDYSFDGTNCFYKDYDGNGILLTSRTLTEDFEKKAYVARSRTKAIGAAGLKYTPYALTGGGITNNISLQDASLGFVGGAAFGATRPEHSGEFTKPIQNTVPFYKELLEAGFLITPNP